MAIVAKALQLCVIIKSSCWKWSLRVTNEVSTKDVKNTHTHTHTHHVKSFLLAYADVSHFNLYPWHVWIWAVQRDIYASSNGPMRFENNYRLPVVWFLLRRCRRIGQEHHSKTNEDIAQRRLHRRVSYIMELYIRATIDKNRHKCSLMTFGMYAN